MSPKYLFQLKVKLGNLYATTEEWKRVMVAALDLGAGDIPSTGKAFDAWGNVLTDVVKDGNLLIKLLQFVTSLNERGNKDQFLLNLLDTLQDAHRRQIETLARAIKSKQCVLFLGPGLLLCSQDGNLVPFDRAFSQELAAKLKQRPEPIFFEETKKEQLSYIAQRYNEIPTFTPEDLGQRASKFYYDNQDDNPRIYERLAELYFPIIINTNPDKNLYQAIEKRKPNSCIYRYYSFENNQTLVNDAQPIQNSPDGPLNGGNDPKTLFYNLLGSFDAPGSMMLSESRLLKFMDKVLRERPAIDKKIKAEFDDQKYYLFLGFDIEQWYVKILFSTVLGISRQEGRGFSVFPENMVVTPANQDFFEEEFKFYFITNDLGKFVSQLVQKYQEL
ncbi:SIR2 family protein [Spirosoma aerophilum]